MGRYSIGIDLGGTKILTALTDKTNGSVSAFVKKKTKKDKGTEKIIQKIINSVKELISENKIDLSEIDNIGIGAAGQIDRENGIIITAPNLNCSNLNIKSILENEFNLPVLSANDVEAATIGEMYFGAGRNETNFVCVFAGTGIGSGIVSDGRLRYGASGSAGEIGHIVVDIGGRSCGCGSCGCLEAYASRLAIEKRIIGALKKGRQSDIVNYLIEGKPVKTNMIKKALDNKDELVTQILNEAADYLGSGLASVINFYNPSLIILGGGLMNALDYFYDRTIETARIKALPVSAGAIRFKKAELGDFSGVTGAAMLAEYRNGLR